MGIAREAEAAKKSEELGANMDAKDNGGETPAHHAAHKGHAEALRALKEEFNVGDAVQAVVEFTSDSNNIVIPQGTTGWICVIDEDGHALIDFKCRNGKVWVKNQKLEHVKKQDPASAVSS